MNPFWVSRLAGNITTINFTIDDYISDRPKFTTISVTRTISSKLRAEVRHENKASLGLRPLARDYIYVALATPLV